VSFLRSCASIVLLSARLIAGDFNWTLPPGFPRPVIPLDNPMSAAKVELGRRLFYDKRMSVNGKSSCGTCHRQQLAFTDGRGRAQGTTGQLHPRSAMSLVNVAYVPFLTWENPTITSLEEQALVPMLGEDPVELGLKGREEQFVAAVDRDPIYRTLLAESFPGESSAASLSNITKAIAAFERSIVSMRSPYDRYRWAGDSSAISDAAKRGELLFFSSERAGCFQCHAGWNFGAGIRFEGNTPPRMNENVPFGFFNTGVSTYEAPNRGLYEQTRKTDDIGKFRVPSVRNIAVTAPYMHDGSIATLEEVIEHYGAGGRFNHPNKSRIVRPFHLADGEKRDLIEFLKSLTDEELLHDPRWSDPWDSQK
jgi:cytochrome c peroxidase